MHNRLSLISLRVFGDYLSQLLHGWTTLDVYLDVIPYLRKKNAWLKGSRMYFLTLFMLKIRVKKNPWMETSGNKQDKLSRQKEFWNSVEKPECKSWEIILGKSKDDIGISNFYLI